MLVETTSLSDVKTNLSAFVERAEREHEQFTITRNGRPAAVLVSADEWESLQETLFWLGVPGIHESIAEARAEAAAGTVYTLEEVRARLNLPRES